MKVLLQLITGRVVTSAMVFFQFEGKHNQKDEQIQVARGFKLVSNNFPNRIKIFE